MAQDPLFSKLFGQSPFAPLQRHMDVTHHCAKAMIGFFDAVFNEDWERVNQIGDQIAALEGEADNIKREIRLHLPKSLFLPVSRTDLLELLSVQDGIANRARDIAGLIRGRQTNVPESLQTEMSQYVHHAITAIQFAEKAIAELDELIETGFLTRELNAVDRHLQQLDDAESASDALQIQIRSQLFAIEQHLDPVDVMFLYRIIDLIGDLADQAQSVGNRMLCLIAR